MGRKRHVATRDLHLPTASIFVVSEDRRLFLPLFPAGARLPLVPSGAEPEENYEDVIVEVQLVVLHIILTRRRRSSLVRGLGRGRVPRSRRYTVSTTVSATVSTAISTTVSASVSASVSVTVSVTVSTVATRAKTRALVHSWRRCTPGAVFSIHHEQRRPQLSGDKTIDPPLVLFFIRMHRLLLNLLLSFLLNVILNLLLLLMIKRPATARAGCVTRKLLLPPPPRPEEEIKYIMTSSSPGARWKRTGTAPETDWTDAVRQLRRLLCTVRAVRLSFHRGCFHYLFIFVFPLHHDDLKV